MPKPTDRILSVRKSMVIVLWITLLAFWLGSVVCMIFGFMDFNYLIAGGVFFVIFTTVILAILFNASFFIQLSSDEVKETTFFGKIKKANHLDGLQGVDILPLVIGGKMENYLCLNFSSKDISSSFFQKVYEEDDIILFAYSLKNESILKKYIDLPIVDKRKN